MHKTMIWPGSIPVTGHLRVGHCRDERGLADAYFQTTVTSLFYAYDSTCSTEIKTITRQTSSRNKNQIRP